MNIEPKMKRRLIIGALALIALMLILGVATTGKKKAITKVDSTKVPAAIVQPASAYIAGREDAIGDDQTSPSSWTNSVKNSITANWYQSLQPVQNSSTGSTPYTYTVAHDNHYRVSAKVTNCIWVGSTPNISTIKSVTVACSIYDTVVHDNGSIVEASSLPYGWGNVGRQPVTVVTLEKQGSSWLVSGEPVDQQTE
jgi:hypothetical protein